MLWRLYSEIKSICTTTCQESFIFSRQLATGLTCPNIWKPFSCKRLSRLLQFQVTLYNTYRYVIWNIFFSYLKEKWRHFHSEFIETGRASFQILCDKRFLQLSFYFISSILCLLESNIFYSPIEILLRFYYVCLAIKPTIAGAVCDKWVVYRVSRTAHSDHITKFEIHSLTQTLAHIVLHIT